MKCLGITTDGALDNDQFLLGVILALQDSLWHSNLTNMRPCNSELYLAAILSEGIFRLKDMYIKKILSFSGIQVDTGDDFRRRKSRYHSFNN